MSRVAVHDPDTKRASKSDPFVRISVYSLPAKRALTRWNCAIFKKRRPFAGLPSAADLLGLEGACAAGRQLPSH